MTNNSDTPVSTHALTVTQEKCLVKHARELFTKLVQVGPGLTDQNIAGVTATAKTAIELAELFQRTLKEAGYAEPHGTEE